MSSKEDHDPRMIWQNQVGGGTPMTLEQIRRKAEEIDAKTRQQLMANTLIAAILTVSCVWGIWVNQDSMQRAGLVFTIVWSWIAQHSSIKQMISPGLAGEAALSTGLEFYRNELKRRKNYFRRPWLWFLGPVLAAIGFYMLPIFRSIIGNPGSIQKITPFGVILSIWVILILIRTRREYLAVQKMIDELGTLENKNGLGEG